MWKLSLHLVVAFIMFLESMGLHIPIPDTSEAFCGQIKHMYIGDNVIRSSWNSSVFRSPNVLEALTVNICQTDKILRKC